MATQALSSLFSSDAQAKFARKVIPVAEQPSTTQDAPEENTESSAEDSDEEKHGVDNKDNRLGEDAEQRDGGEDRTVFVGNVPLAEATNKTLKRLFSPFGEIQSIRIRSLPIAGTKVDEAGNQNLVKKESVAKAIKAMDNTVLEGRHLRVDKIPPSVLDNQTTVFVGNLPRLADEEELREFFTQQLAEVGGNDAVRCVRLVRDKDTQEGRGFGYVQLSSRQVAARALGLEGAKFKDKHALRIRKCVDAQRQKSGQSRSPAPSGSRRAPASGGADRPPSAQSAASLSVNAKHALKRLKKKAAATKKKLQKAKKPKAHKAQRKTK
eukprot:gene32457-39245_t